MTTSREEFVEEIKRYASNRREVLREVELFREELLENFREKMGVAESGIQNTLYNTKKEPEIYPVLSPKAADLGAKGKDELLVAISTAFLELSESDYSKVPLYKVMRQAEKEAGKETETGDITKKIYEGMKGMKNPLNPESEFNWSAMYENQDNSILINELPQSVLPPRKDTPGVMGPFWHAMNTTEDFSTDRNHGWRERDLFLRIIHEMTHAFNYVQLSRDGKNLGFFEKDPGQLSSHERDLLAVDEAVSGVTGYLYTENIPDEDYSHRGIEQEELKELRRMYADYADEKMQAFSSSDYPRKKVISRMRAHSFYTMKDMIENSKPARQAFKDNIKEE